MKIIASSEKKILRVSKTEWLSIGKKAGWIKTANTNILKIKDLSIIFGMILVYRRVLPLEQISNLENLKNLMLHICIAKQDKNLKDKLARMVDVKSSIETLFRAFGYTRTLKEFIENPKVKEYAVKIVREWLQNQQVLDLVKKHILDYNKLLNKEIDINSIENFVKTGDVEEIIHASPVSSPQKSVLLPQEKQTILKEGPPQEDFLGFKKEPETQQEKELREREEEMGYMLNKVDKRKIRRLIDETLDLYNTGKLTKEQLQGRLSELKAKMNFMIKKYAEKSN